MDDYDNGKVERPGLQGYHRSAPTRGGSGPKFSKPSRAQAELEPEFFNDFKALAI